MCSWSHDNDAVSEDEELCRVSPPLVSIHRRLLLLLLHPVTMLRSELGVSAAAGDYADLGEEVQISHYKL
jgi:hypothetical protein